MSVIPRPRVRRSSLARVRRRVIVTTHWLVARRSVVVSLVWGVVLHLRRLRSRALRRRRRLCGRHCRICCTIWSRLCTVRGRKWDRILVFCWSGRWSGVARSCGSVPSGTVVILLLRALHDGLVIHRGTAANRCAVEIDGSWLSSHRIVSPRGQQAVW